MRASRRLPGVVSAALLLVPAAPPAVAAQPPGPYPLPWVTFNFTKADPMRQVDVTVVTEDEVVRSFGVELGESDYDRLDRVMVKLHRKLKSNGYDVDAIGGYLIVWGTRHARVAEVRVSLTGRFPGDENPKPVAPLVEAEDGGAGLVRYNFPRRAGARG